MRFALNLVICGTAGDSGAELAESKQVGEQESEWERGHDKEGTDGSCMMLT